MSMRWISLLAGVGILLMASVAQANIWDNDSGNYLWETATNWSGNALPSAYVWLNTASSSANPVSLSSNQTISGNVHIGQAATTGVGYLSQTSGTLTVGGFYLGDGAGSLGDYSISNATFTSGGWRLYIGKTGTGTLRMSSGSTFSHTHAGGLLEVGNDSAGVGTINMSGGSLSTYKMRLGAEAGTGYVNQSGGTITISNNLQFGHDSNGTGTGTVTVSDSANFSAVSIAGTGTAKIVLDGSRTSGGTNMAFSGNYSQNSLSTLKGIIDAAAIATATDMRKIVVAGNVTFSSGSKLDVAFDGSPAAGTWTLMSWSGTLTNSGLAFAAGVDTNVWSFTLDSTAKTLTVTYVPEPATLALLGLGGLGLLLRRKRS